jgi:putative transposase
MVEKSGEISIKRQCELASISRAGVYYSAAGESQENLHLMRLIDEEYTRHPFYGSRRLAEFLKGRGYAVNRKRVTRLMRAMGIEAIAPKKNLSRVNAQDTKYPYLLSGLAINRVDQVWCADITYIRLERGFVYLAAVLDWQSRRVLAWDLSNTMETKFCADVLERALQSGHKPEIFNSDQGVQFTSEKFAGILEREQIKISRDGRGRALDNIIVERFWRSLKYEEVYLHDYAELKQARQAIERYIEFYNTERMHQSLGYKTPWEVYEKQSIAA